MTDVPSVLNFFPVTYEARFIVRGWWWGRRAVKGLKRNKKGRKSCYGEWDSDLIRETCCSEGTVELM